MGAGEEVSRNDSQRGKEGFASDGTGDVHVAIQFA